MDKLTPQQVAVLEQVGTEIVARLMEHLEKSLLYYTFNSLASFIQEETEIDVRKDFIKSWKKAVCQDVVNPQLKDINKFLNSEKLFFKNLIEENYSISTEDAAMIWNSTIRQIEDQFLQERE